MNVCRLPYCDNPVRVVRDQLCTGHYKQQRTGKPFTPLRKRSPKYVGCAVGGCDRPHRARGYCHSHVQRIYKGLTVDLDAPIQRRTSPLIRKDADGNFLCSRCETYLPADQFNKGAGASGLTTWCRRCSVLSRYGMSRTQYDDLLAAQGGVCAICEQPSAVLFVDHDHSCCPGDKTCGKCNRGLLCNNCNMAIGLLRDDPERIRRAADYLEGYQCSPRNSVPI